MVQIHILQICWQEEIGNEFKTCLLYTSKAETTDEIAGCAAAMREHAVQVKTGMDVFEIVGTGGDNAQSFNCLLYTSGSDTAFCIQMY